MVEVGWESTRHPDVNFKTDMARLSSTRIAKLLTGREHIGLNTNRKYSERHRSTLFLCHIFHGEITFSLTVVELTKIRASMSRSELLKDIDFIELINILPFSYHWNFCYHPILTINPDSINNVEEEISMMIMTMLFFYTLLCSSRKYFNENGT